MRIVLQLLKCTLRLDLALFDNKNAIGEVKEINGVGH